MDRWYSGRRNRVARWMYALLVVVLVMTYICRGYLFGPDKTVAASMDMEGETTLPSVKPTAESGRGQSLLRFAKPTAEDNPQVSKIISEAMSYLGEPAGIIDARDRLNDALSLSMSGRQRAFVKAQLSELAYKWLFSRMIFPRDKLCVPYKVKPGDLLSRIGRQFKVPYEIIMKINNISRPEALQADTTIKVINGPFHVRVYRSTFTMDLYLQNTFVRSFPCGLGKPGMETPTGLWAVKNGGKLITPRWTDPISGKTYESEDPDYPLGSRWIGLRGLRGEAVGRTGFAIHGTKKLGEIGTASSQGCIRLRDDDAVLVFNLLVPGDSRVEIME